MAKTEKKRTRRTVRDLELENAELRGKVAALEKALADAINGGAQKAIVYTTPGADSGPPFVTLPFITKPLQSVDSCAHEYPAAWWGINPPPCKKCGYTPPMKFETTITMGGTEILPPSISGLNFRS